MSLEAAATVAAPLVEKPVACVYNVSARHVRYLTKFGDNFESLKDKVSELCALRDDVNTRIVVEEASQQRERTRAVAQWLQKVEAFEKEVDLISLKCSSEIEQRCCANYCPKNWWARYNLGKKVCKKLIIVAELIGKSKFDLVADKSPPTQVEVQPENTIVGMDGQFDEVWSWIADDQVTTIGIYGMGGVGKTTLLKKINNAFAEQVCKFDIVIWVVVSSQFSLLNVQKQIGARLGLTWFQEEDQNDKAHQIFNVLRKKKFLLLLDDVWKHLDLEAIGIPSPHISHNKSKVVFTTRSEKVCGEMEVSKKYKVPVLGWEQSWELFQQKVGHEDLNYHSELLELAKAVAKECDGLPLALITTGRAMATKMSPHEWNHALTTLKRYAAEFSGMEEGVLSILKFSYASLDDDTVRKCFLYCSLYPEDCDIEINEIIQKWVGEGFLEKFQDMDAAVDKGHDIIGSLKAACMLETASYGRKSYVKMHDIIRDLALWIARECGENENNYLVQAGIGLSQVPAIEGWNVAERISLTRNNELKELTGAPDCPRLVTLMLQRNHMLSVIPSVFFQYMPNLKVLDLGCTSITDLPKSIGCLLELRYLNLFVTPIVTLPIELKNLVKLNYLSVQIVSGLQIPDGIISCFSKLQFLRLTDIYLDGLETEWEDLQQLRVLEIGILNLPTSQGMFLSQRSQSYIEVLRFIQCMDLTELTFMSSLHLGKTKKLRELEFSNCSNLRRLTINSLKFEDDDTGSLFTVEVLRLVGLQKLVDIIWDETAILLHFKHLTEVTICGCLKLKDISWLVLVPFLRDLDVAYCSKLEEIIVDRFATVAIEEKYAFSRLESMSFHDLPRLKSIVRAPFSFPSLRSIDVSSSPLLKKLPFASDIINNSTLQQIKGGAKWWNELEWEDLRIKTSLQPIFMEDYPIQHSFPLFPLV